MSRSDLKKNLDSILYPEIEPFSSGMHRASKLHEIYFEQVGSADGTPVVFLHGGPGGGISQLHRRFFNPQKYHVVLFDQRGCGKSLPFAELKENTTWDLVEDIESLRKKFGFEKWIVFGGSWGSTLALAYAQSYPESCAGFVLRGIFTMQQRELDWLYKDGMSRIHPEAWEKFLEPLHGHNSSDHIESYYKLLNSNDHDVALRAARALGLWEATGATLELDSSVLDHFQNDKNAVAFSKIAMHFFYNKGWFKTDNQLLEGVDRISHLPCTIVQGRYDALCPPETAWQLHKRWAGSKLDIRALAGHAQSEVEIAGGLRQAMDNFTP